MRRVGQARRRDANEPEIVKALQQVGAEVIKHGGKGEPDLFVRFRGRWFAGEVKTKRGTLTEAQEEAGAGERWPVWKSPKDALSAIGVE